MTLPVFTSHFSIGQSLLTLEEPGKAKAGGAVSVFDLAKEAGLREVVLVDERPDGFVAAYKTASKLGAKLCFGLKLVVCANADDKSDASLRTESKVVVFARDTQGYHDLVRIWNRAATTGYYYQPRTCYAWLREQWSSHLLLALPYFSSFIARNTLTFDAIVPDLPIMPWVFKEVESELPFARLIDGAIDRYAQDNGAPVVETKSIYYPDTASFKAYMVLRAIANRSTFARPKIDHLSSSTFSWEAFMRLTNVSPA